LDHGSLEIDLVPGQPLNLCPTQTCKSPDCPKRQHVRTGTFEQPRQFADGKNCNLCLPFFCTLHVGNRILAYAATSLGEAEKRSQPPAVRVARSRGASQATQPFIDAGRADSGNYLLAKRLCEPAKPHPQVAQITCRHPVRSTRR